MLSFSVFHLYVFVYFISETYKVEMDYRPACAGRQIVPLLFEFYREKSQNTFKILREINIESMKNPTLYTLLKPKKPYERPKREGDSGKLEIVESEFKPLFE